MHRPCRRRIHLESMEALDGYYGVRARVDGKQGSNFWFAIPYKPDHTSVEEFYTVTEPSSKSQHTLSTTDQTFEPSHDAEHECNSLVEPCITGVSTESSKLNILLVDDSFSILKVVGSMLRKHGHYVTEALNGEEALCELTKNDKELNSFDVIIIDLHMPVMDGKTLNSKYTFQILLLFTTIKNKYNIRF